MNRSVEPIARRGGRRRTALAVTAALLAAAGPPTAALAEDRPAVAVRCALTSAALQSLYGPEVSDQIAAGLCRTLAENHLAEHPRLGLWRYEANTEGPVELSFEILDGGATETVGRLKLLKDTLPKPFCPGSDAAPPPETEGGERLCWEATIAEPGDVGDPLPDDAPAAFAEKLRAKILEPFGFEIENLLKPNMPLARALWLAPAGDPPMLVAALPWSEFQKLRESVFKVLCRHSDEKIEVEAVGHASPAAFPPEPPPPRISQALVVALRPPPAIPGLGDMVPEGLYLVDDNPPDITSIDDDFFPEDGD